MRSIRIPESLDDVLKNHASENHMSVNSFIYSILVKYAEWDHLSDKFGKITLTREHFSSILEIIDDEKLAEASKRLGTHIPKAAMNFWFKKSDFSTFIDMLSLISRYGKLFNFEVVKENDRDIVLVIRHTFGEKGTIWIKNYLGEAIKSFSQDEPIYEVQKNVVVFKFKTRRFL